METQAINDNENENCNQGFNENLENVENEVEKVPDLRRSQRTIKKSSRFDDNYEYSGCIYVNYCSADSPVSFKEAIESDESNFWIDAMNKEMNSLEKIKLGISRKTKQWKGVRFKMDLY